ncbi:HET-domain-containing protein [Acephala macrosclerotiorum]|nr:HET-domain-containing protein [Acephala macrosclerotiorum]
MLCTLCSNLQLFARDAEHHKSYRALLNSAKSGCEFCTVIFQRDLGKRRHNPGDDLVSEPVEDSIEKIWADGEIIAKHEEGFMAMSEDVEQSGASSGEEKDDDSGVGEDDTSGDEDWGSENDEDDDENDSFPRSTQIYYTMHASYFERGCIEFTQPNGLENFKEEFWYWVKNDDPLSATMGHLERYVEPGPSSPTSLSFEAKWLQECSSNHTTCPPSQDHPLPTRVLDLGTPSSTSTPYLLITNAQPGKYVALSHCWGGSLPLNTITSTLPSRQAGIPFSEFPKTFQDAVTITKRLGFQYLWIDSLCIIQDSKSDWAAEAARMGMVYKHSTLTISANIAGNPHVGILQSRDLDKVLELPCIDEEKKVQSVPGVVR